MDLYKWDTLYCLFDNHLHLPPGHGSELSWQTSYEDMAKPKHLSVDPGWLPLEGEGELASADQDGL